VGGAWKEEQKAGNSPHSDWVRDVAWAPNTATPYNIIASCSEDRSVYIWKQTERDELWTNSLLATFDAPVWRVSWSVTGNVLAVSTGDHKVTLWKQAVDETWLQISTVDN
jgi:protein transport protein SEC13